MHVNEFRFDLGANLTRYGHVRPIYRASNDPAAQIHFWATEPSVDFHNFGAEKPRLTGRC
jgi:hypothetical protein